MEICRHVPAACHALTARARHSDMAAATGAQLAASIGAWQASQKPVLPEYSNKQPERALESVQASACCKSNGLAAMQDCSAPTWLQPEAAGALAWAVGTGARHAPRVPALPRGYDKQPEYARACAGIRLLQAMGWRQGKGVGPSRAAPDSGSKSRWGKEAGIGAENVPIYALPPKTDTHGLGFDPFKV